MAAEEVPIRYLALEILVEHALVFAVGFARKVARGTQLFVVLAQLAVVKAFVAYHHQSARIIKQADDHEKEFGKPLVDVSVAFGQVCCPEPQVVPSTRRMTFLDKLNQRIAKTGSNLCVGLDVRAENAEETTKRWILDVIAQTAPFAAAFKPNSAYFEALGWRGVKMLEEILKEIPKDIPVVLDVKRGDIGETQGYYAKACFDVMNVDAVTLNAYMGRDTLEPFLKYTDKGLYLLGVTSNPGAKDIELQKAGDRQVYELVAEMTKGHPQAGLVVGLTNAAPDVLDHIPDVPLLIPGLGAQGGDLAALKGSGRKAPLLVNVSRGVLYQKDELSFAQRAEYWMRQIEQALA